MAQIVIEFDTVTKQGVVKMDGKEMSDASEVSLYRYGDEWGLRVESTKHDEDNKMGIRTTVYAEQKEPADPDSVVNDIHSFFKVQD